VSSLNARLVVPRKCTYYLELQYAQGQATTLVSGVLTWHSQLTAVQEESIKRFPYKQELFFTDANKCLFEHPVFHGTERNCCHDCQVSVATRRISWRGSSESLNVRVNQQNKICRP
jgi:hypothetical protein